jgi:hypothetical protein
VVVEDLGDQALTMVVLEVLEAEEVVLQPLLVEEHNKVTPPLED